MDPITQQTTLASAGGKKDPLYVDDVFSTYIYEGTGSTKTINNGIDLAGEGGLVWFKNRQVGWEHSLFDTERGVQKMLQTPGTAPQYDRIASGDNDTLSSFNNNGFTFETLGAVNGNGNDLVSWTFRKAPGFFDVVTYTGNGSSSRNIAHNLGSVPGMIITKRYNTTTSNWQVYHRSLGATKYINLDTNLQEVDNANRWNDTEPTSTQFTVGSVNNNNGVGFVAYIFAHDDASFGTDGDESIIKCGSVVNNGSQVTEVNLGFEPEFVLIKNASVSEHWFMFDVMRGMDVTRASKLFPNRSNAEDIAGYSIVSPTATGFSLSTASAGDFANGTYIYMAIRRPHKPPEAGTDVFAAHTSSSANGTKITTGFPIDMQFARWSAANVYNNTAVNDRIRGVSSNDTEKSITLITSRDDAETAGAANAFGSEYWDNTGFRIHSYGALTASIYQSFRRAPGFFDMVAYEGNSTNSRQINHNLGVAPELVIIKNRDAQESWPVWTAYGDYPASEHVHGFLGSNGTAAFGNYGAFSNAVDQSTLFTDSIFTVNTSTNWANGSGYSFIAYLFASLDGISKVGRYSGTGNNIDVNCGFTNGARFVLITRMDLSITTNNTSGYYVWDTARGIVSGDDPYFRLNDGDAEVINRDWIDPLNAGFTVTSDAPLALNTPGGTYLFFAIA